MKTKSVFACINTNLKVRLNSSSGGGILFISRTCH